MSKWRWGLIALGLVSIVGVLLWSYFFNQDTVTLDQQAETKPAPPKPIQPAFHVMAKQPKQPVDDSAILQDPYQDEAIKAQMLQVADLYEEASQYPHYSQPIRNPESVQQPAPFKETEVDLPYPLDGLAEPIRLAAAVERYQYFKGDTINVRLMVSGAPSDTYIEATATLANQQSPTPFTTKMAPTDERLNSFVAAFETNVIPPGVLTTELMVQIEVEIGGDKLFTTVPLRYAEASATMVGIAYVRPEAENLLIALQYAVFSPGYYFVSAILEDAQTGQPLIQLQGEGRMPQGNGILILKAHSHALKAMGSEGPYVVRSIKTYRGAESGEQFDVPANQVQPQFQIQGFPFSEYDDVAYQDELAAERLEFLRNLGVGREENED
ncbi:hypothetical protein GCM10008090_25100 [Arenicella chitinivorans]|uniref:Uncharacterized protein n=1 Tax=Arenicella chitinivorans TaxID=1329800 RepID=A0A918VQ74_9GAMM|nr:hypothetical protein [Arenicella chitinivorans]GHA14304.1 hypothetical protein GCM10008090_25100 [Arenicella chitinivorans]